MSSWYYASGNERQGPCEEAQIADLIRSGAIRRETLVWAQGMGDWKAAGELSAFHQLFGANPAPTLPPPAAPPPAYAPPPGASTYAAPPGVAPAYAPAAPAYGPHAGPPGAPSPYQITQYQTQLSGFDGTYTAYLVCLYLGLPLIFLFGLGIILWLVALVLHFTLLARFWAVIQDGPGEARTTPGKAVGFMLIPLFNLYWVFQAYSGLAADMKNYGRRRGIPVQDSEGIALVGSIFTIAGAALSYFIIWPVVFGQMKTSAKQILSWKIAQAGGAPAQAPSYSPY